MIRRTVLTLAVLVLLSSATSAEDNSFDSCLRKDSISCVQIHVYKKLRALFSQETINLLAGFQLVRGSLKDQGRALVEDTIVDQEILGAKDVMDRQSALEDFVYEKMRNILTDRSFRWNFSPAVEQIASTARMAVDSLPGTIKEKMMNYVTEGRGKKKILKSLIPVLIAAKVKLVAFLGVAYVIIALIAKKALVASAIALAITLFISIKKILAKHHYHPHHYEVHGEAYHGSLHHPPISNGWSGWDNGYDLHGSHTSSHHLPYSGQKPIHS